MFDVNHFSAIQVGLASPERIREWSYGEVKKPETINYRSQKPEKDGLFCEKIFGPAKDYECNCGKYKKVRYYGHVCEKCGVEVTTKSVRRERMGHIELATPVAHIWYLKGIPSRMAQILDISPKGLEEVVYFISHICLKDGILKATNLKNDEKIVSLNLRHNHFSAITSEGRVLMFGENEFGQLGNGRSTYKAIPTNIIDKFKLNPKEKVLSVSVGYNHTLALTSEGRVFMWGENKVCRVDDETKEKIKVPNNITNLFNLNNTEKIVSLNAGYNHFTALTSEGRVFMWGVNDSGQLGEGSYDNRNYPLNITSKFSLHSDEKIISVNLGYKYSLALTSLGRVFEWGVNDWVQGEGTTLNKNTPTNITKKFTLNDQEKIVNLYVGHTHYAALTSLGRVFMWGANDSGQLGDGTFANKNTPIDITAKFSLNSKESITSLNLGHNHSSALTSEKRVFIWGENKSYQLGEGSTMNRSTPTDITNQFSLNSDEKITSVNLGNNHSLALTSQGRVFMWGDVYLNLINDDKNHDLHTPFNISHYFNISTVIQTGEVLDEKSARTRFSVIIEEIKKRYDEESPYYNSAEEFLQRINNPNETFDFYTYSKFISDHTGAEFGIGAEAVKRLLEEVELDDEFDVTKEELKETINQKNLKRQKLIKRLEIIEAFRSSKNKPQWMILDVLPVIPPDLRPMLQLDGGRFATSDLNDLYRRVITRNIRLKKLQDIKAPSVILMNEKRMLQEAVDALIDNGRRTKAVTGAAGRTLKSLSHSLKGKQGRFRQNLLGKRVDYSGRSVITVGPDLKMYQCGIPREMAVQLFKPFIAQQLIDKGFATGHKAAEKLIEQLDERIWDIVEDIIKKHPVLLNRAPTLHRLGIQAFEPKLVKGRAIRLHPLVTPAFNADFDGDQMAVHVPLSDKAISEARNLMLGSNNILGPKDGRPIVTPGQDMVLGNYYLTMEVTKNEFLARAQKYEANNELEKAERYRLYAESEGKVFRNPDEAILAYETNQISLNNRIAVRVNSLKKTCFTEKEQNRVIVTTVGKLIFNQIFPIDFPYLNRISDINRNKNGSNDIVPHGEDVREFIAKLEPNNPFTKKNIGFIINEVFRRFGTEETSKMLDKLKDQGFNYATIAGVTVSISDITSSDIKEGLFEKADQIVNRIHDLNDKGYYTEDGYYKDIIQLWDSVKSEIEKELVNKLKKDKKNPIQMMADSGARGNASHFTQLSGMRGLMNNPTGRIIEVPIKSSLRDGLTVAEYFISTHGARKGGADTALKTAESGYLTRRLVDVAQDVIISEDDCGTDHGFVVKAIKDRNLVGSTKDKPLVSLADRLNGRFSLYDIIDKNGVVIVEKDKLITEEDIEKIEKSGIEQVEIRNLFGCQSKNGVCVKCYGRNLATGKVVEIGEAVGIMAAQSIGEPGTQLTMRTFHTGGVHASEDITLGLPRVQELFEARKPKVEAVISQISGEVTKIEQDKEGNRYIVVVKNNNDEITYHTPFGLPLRVKEKDMIINGQEITDGSINPKELLKVSDVTAVENYILEEVQKVYRLQAVDLADKHIEVVIRQMLKKLLIVEGGDTGLLPGSRIDIHEFTRLNREILLQGKKPAYAKPLLLGITKASLETESFLSAASFQETTKVLTDAATKGKIDRLVGLKENVIIGKLIPAGTGRIDK